VYERTAAENLPGLRDALRPGDVVIVHDPQPAGLVPTLLADGHVVVWRCHVGLDWANEWSERAWSFLRPYVEDATAFVFSRGAFAPRWVEQRRLAVIPPAIDPLAPKNEALDPETVVGVLSAAGLIASDGVAPHPDVSHPARIAREGSAPAAGTPLVVQVSRWDRLKDMAGVMQAFASGVDAASGAHLLLAGPAVEGVDDDPEGLEVWNETVERRRALATAERERVHLVAVPMHDPPENALVVNALQTHARVVVQKSLAEGFGLTVAEAMWKSRPVVASAVGGIADQIVDGESGLLLDDPRDLGRMAELVSSVLASPAEAARLGANARARVAERFLPDRQLLQYAELLERFLEDGRG